ncbi:MAG: hypothetical protein HY528_01535 [Chloroflexi bacterium]|nr:hypothetical protein [Chloroflexota bacterium]
MAIEWPSWIPMPGLIIPLVIVWDMSWRGVALWKAGRSARLAWFIALLIFNTVGILPIIYIFGFSKRS